MGINIITINKIKYSIFNIYVYPKSNVNFAQLFCDINFNDKCIIVGDFNAKHFYWNNSGNNKTGVLLNNSIQNNNLKCHVKYIPTLINNFNNESTVDLILTKNNCSLKIMNIKNGESLGSDHLPIEFNLSLNESIRINKAIKYNWNKVDISSYKKFLVKNLCKFIYICYKKK